MTEAPASSELLGSLPAFLPTLVPSETLFSLAARYHRLCGNASARQTSIQLFGDARAGLRHDFPSHLDQFAAITQGMVGDVESLAYERTLFGYFAPFQDAAGAAAVLGRMRGTSVEKVKSALGLLPSRLGGFFPLKACPDCIKEDMRNHSSGTWHLEHQWPSVWICRKHRKLLHAVQHAVLPKDLRRWLLPEDIKTEEWERLAISSDTARSKLIWLAELSSHIAQRSARHFDGQLLRYTYLLQAKRKCWLNTNGSVKLGSIRPAFLDYFQCLVHVPTFRDVLDVGAQHAGMLGLLLRQYDWRRHPVKHLLMMAFLFDSITEFEFSYNFIAETHENFGTDALKELVGESWRNELKILIESENKSLTSAASIIGIPLCVAIRVAKQDGLSYKKRKRVFNTKTGMEIQKMMVDGLSRAEILEKSGIKRRHLHALMARTPDLRDQWRKLDFANSRKARRANFLKLLAKHRGVPLKRIRTIHGNGASWLYRNDRAWFESHLPSLC